MTLAGYKGPADRFGTLEAVKGESYDGEIIMCQSDGVTPIVLTGFNPSFYLWSDPASDPIAEANEGNGGITVLEEDGTIQIHFSDVFMGTLLPVAYLFQLWGDNGFGSRKLILWGYFWVKGGMST